MVVTLSPIGDRTRMTVATNFASTDQFEQVLDLGMEEGMRQAVGQIDEVLSR